MIENIAVIKDADGYRWGNDWWHDEIHPDFDETVVIIGGDNNYGHEEAKWWQDACELFHYMEDYCDDDSDGYDGFVRRYVSEYSEDKLHDIWGIYWNTQGLNDTETLVAIAEIIYPWLQLEYSVIRDYYDSVEVVYIKGEIDIDILSDWYFNHLVGVCFYSAEDIKPLLDEEDEEDLYNEFDYDTISCDEETMITSTEYFRMYHSLEGMKQALAKYFGYNPDTLLVIDNT